MPTKLLNVPHCRQHSDGDCLAACAWMVLSFLGHQQAYSTLLTRLDIRSFGAPATNIQRLDNAQHRVIYSQTDMEGLRSYLNADVPVIVFVRTQELPY